MKDAYLAQLFAHSPAPTLVIKGDNPKWHNLAFAALSKPLQRELKNWASSGQGRCTLIDNQVFMRTEVDAYQLIAPAEAPDSNQLQQLTFSIVDALKQGNDPFYVFPEILSQLLGWGTVKGIKLGDQDTLICVGDFTQGQYQPPKTLNLDHDPAARLYTDTAQACLVHQNNDQDTWLAVRVESSKQRPLGHFWLGMPGDNACKPSECLQLVHLCSQLATAWLSDTHRPDTTDPAPSDPLTGLASRDALDRLLQQCEQRFKQQSNDFLLAMIDIDGLSAVNQSLGQRAGDEVLHQFADHLRHICRASDRLFRFGGDEFVILFHQDDLSPPLQERLERINTRMSKELGQAFHSSFGTAALSEARGSGDELLLLADSRLRKAKLRN